MRVKLAKMAYNRGRERVGAGYYENSDICVLPQQSCKSSHFCRINPYDSDESNILSLFRQHYRGIFWHANVGDNRGANGGYHKKLRYFDCAAGHESVVLGFLRKFRYQR